LIRFTVTAQGVAHTAHKHLRFFSFLALIYFLFYFWSSMKQGKVGFNLCFQNMSVRLVAARFPLRTAAHPTRRRTALSFNNGALARHLYAPFLNLA
jgi:hypothetical protein